MVLCPFAYDAGGNILFLSLRDSDYDCIYWYRQDALDIYKTSSSFEEFRTIIVST
jgi:hypothetical protein